MTKLSQWLAVLITFFAVWVILLADQLPSISLSASSKEVLWLLPIYLLIAFACYSLAVIGYRVAMFNDCTEAADEIHRQIDEARKELTTKGFKFSN